MAVIVIWEVRVLDEELEMEDEEGKGRKREGCLL